METEQQSKLPTDAMPQQLSADKQRLLEQRLKGSRAPRQPERISPRDEQARVPISAEQKRVWLHAAEDPDSPIYNEPFTIYRDGPFDKSLFEASLNSILARHEAWRTSFSSDGEQIIHSEVTVTLPLVSLEHLNPGEQEQEALRLAVEDAKLSIPLLTAPLFRAFIVRTAPASHRIYFTFHHIIFDGVSIARIFVPELTATYDSLARGGEPPVASPSLHYADYAVWRERHVESPEVLRHLAYWREHLSGELPVLRLPEDHPHSPRTSRRGAMKRFIIPADLLAGLKFQCDLQGITLYMLLLAAFKALLFRYSGQQDIIVGSATDGRRKPELVNMMGYFLDTFAIRTHPHASLQFAAFATQVRDAVLAGIVAADVPFDRVVREINPKRHAGRLPIFQTFFSIRPPMAALPAGWRLSQTDVDTGATKFDIFLELGEQSQHMEGRFFFSSDAWDEATIGRMAEHWLTLLRSVCADPFAQLGSLAILTPKELQDQLGPGGWNDTVRSIPVKSVYALIAEQAQRRPSHTAVRFGNQHVTYSQLDDRVDVLASRLQSSGVAADSLVAVALDRSVDLLAGLLAILKLGAAYIPLDIHMPLQRIQLLLENAKPTAILTQSFISGPYLSYQGQIVVADNELQAPATTAKNLDIKNLDIPRAGEPDTNLDATAYVIYTSGTTGEPKGVEISQRSLVNLLAAMQLEPGFTESDTLLAVTPVSFDIAALELFLPLIAGGTVVIASRDEVRDPFRLAELIQWSESTVMQATPSTWRALVMSGWPSAKLAAAPAKLRKILCGGESLPYSLANRLLSVAPEVWNMYGPTETTIWSTAFRLTTPSPDERASVSVGHPILNTRAYVLDAQDQLLPIGIPGELFLGGLGVAKGYYQRPTKTAERFVTADVSPGERLFRTGDLAVRRPDGTLTILGRTDNQIKVRGYRVELEAVESAILQYPGIAAAAARAWPDMSGEMRLIAYFAAIDQAPISTQEVLVFLRESLPDGMIPSVVIQLESIPLTPHGKVDRARLPAPDLHHATSVSINLDTALEQKLASIWRAILNKDVVGPDDDFFDLGGHSLLVATLQREILSQFNKRLSIVELFQCATIRKQASLLEQEGSLSLFPKGVFALQPRGSLTSIFWIHDLKGNLANAIGIDHPLFSLELTDEDTEKLGSKPTLASIANCYIEKILQTQKTGPFILGGLCAWGVLAYEIASHLRNAGHEVALLIMVDAPNPEFLESFDSLARRLSFLNYLLGRAVRQGLRISISRVKERIKRSLARSSKGKSAGTEMMTVQQMIEAAAVAYRPVPYDGQALLILASDHPPHLNFIPGWQKVIADRLSTRFVEGHHRDLMDSHNVQRVADAILSQLSFTERHP